MIHFLRNRAILFFSLLLYTLLLAATLLYFRFPAEKLRLSCQFGLEQLLPVNHCSIGKLGYRFPFTIIAEEIEFKEGEEEGKALLTISQAALTPALSAPRSRFLVTLDGCGGEHEFTLLLNHSNREFTLKDIRLRDLDLTQLPFLRLATAREISGTLQGNGTYHGIWKEGKYEANGQGTITLSQGSFGLLYPILSLKKIDLEHLAAAISLQGKNLDFTKGTFKGQELTGDFSGILGLQSGLKTASLSFQGELVPQPPLLKKSKHAKNMVIQLKKRHNRNGLPFRLNGVVQQPSFRFAPNSFN